MKRLVYFISDGTGITAERLGHSLLTQFEPITFEASTIPYINTIEKAKMVAERLQRAYSENETIKPIVFSTFVDEEIRRIIAAAPVMLIDFFESFVSPLEKELNIKSTHTIGKSHSLHNYNNYMLRINAVNYALNNDDGANIHDYKTADIILIGVSRCGKTPTCLYLALQFGVFAANYPFTEEDLLHLRMPEYLQQQRGKLFGLTIEPLRLQQIRQERRPDSRYASLAQCQKEIKQVENLFRREKLPFLDTTSRSVEELATEIMSQAGIKRKLL